MNFERVEWIFISTVVKKEMNFSALSFTKFLMGSTEDARTFANHPFNIDYKCLIVFFIGFRKVSKYFQWTLNRVPAVFTGFL